MDQIAVRELRNDVSAVLRRVESGERLTITVNGRPVAQLVPIDDRPRFRPWEWFEDIPEADPDLGDELSRAIGNQTTDDVRSPW